MSRRSTPIGSPRMAAGRVSGRRRRPPTTSRRRRCWQPRWAQQLLAAIGALPAAQRAVLELRDILGFTSHEVCELLDISEANQRVLLHRARSKARSIVEGYVGGPGGEH